jgi:RNA polymerase sigma factor (sigma-70 family)
LFRVRRTSNPMPSEDLDWFKNEVKPFEPALRAYLQKRFSVLSDHDDLVQEAYTRVVHARRAGRLTSVKAFLFTITRNLAIDMFRRQQVTLKHQSFEEVEELSALDEPADTITVLEREQRQDGLVDAMALLPERCRMVMRLRHVEGLHIKEIAERLGMAPNTVRVHLVKGVRDCTSRLRQRGLLEAHPAVSRSENPDR